MNPSIKTLTQTAQKPTKTIIGLMSGTSLDGLDIALCQIRGSGEQTQVKLKEFITKVYDSDIQERLKTISSVERPSMEKVCLLHSWLGNHHGKLVLQALETWEIDPADIDCIASHGQTIYHAPSFQHRQKNMPNATLQIGDGDHIAQTTGITTISDFRQKHTAAGGEGAPMASLVDRLLFGDDTEERILLNIGGIANFTYLPARNNSEHTIMTSDTGPGNTLIDAAMQKYFSKKFDRDGKIARRGSVNDSMLESLKSAPFFQIPMPKTTGPEVFNLDWVDEQLKKVEINDLPPEDLVATLTHFTAETVAETIQNFLAENQNPVIYISGGGVHNPVLIEGIQHLVPHAQIKNFDAIGFNADAKEAVVFAVLANEMLSGEGFSMEMDSANSKNINFGKISFPE